jgi:hypothetical protein
MLTKKELEPVAEKIRKNMKDWYERINYISRKN